MTFPRRKYICHRKALQPGSTSNAAAGKGGKHMKIGGRHSAGKSETHKYEKKKGGRWLSLRARKITILCIALCLCLAAVAVGLTYFPRGDFGGFAITAFAEDGEEVSITPSASFTLQKYNLTMEKVPGLPFLLTCDGADTIEIKVEKGKLLIWEAKTSIVRDKGASYTCAPGTTVYWSPLTFEITDKFASRVTFTAYQGGKKLGSGGFTVRGTVTTESGKTVSSGYYISDVNTGR